MIISSTYVKCRPIYLFIFTVSRWKVEPYKKCHNSVKTFSICLKFYTHQRQSYLHKVLKPLGIVNEFVKVMSDWDGALTKWSFQHGLLLTQTLWRLIDEIRHFFSVKNEKKMVFTEEDTLTETISDFEKCERVFEETFSMQARVSSALASVKTRSFWRLTREATVKTF